MSCRNRSQLLESRVIYGPVIYLVGARITPERPAPSQPRRSARIHDLERIHAA
jgi:hypothetical protein